MARLDPAERADFDFFHRLRVRWAEVDAQGIVFNAQYFFLFDAAMTEFMREGGDPARYAEDGARGEMFTVSAQAAFHAPARFDDWLDIGVRLAKLGTSSMTVAMGIWRDDTLLTTGEMVYAYADPQTRTTLPLPEAFRSRIGARGVPMPA